MPNYRRSWVAGGSYFFTVAIADRSRSTLTDHINELRAAFAAERRRTAFSVDAIVILPDHLHCVWTLQADDHDYASKWRRIKAGLSAAIPPTEPRSMSRQRRGERGIWQRRYWEHQIRSDTDFATHVDYIHFNPVKHGYVQAPVHWRWSSIHRYIRAGLLPSDWACEPETMSAGE